MVVGNGGVILVIVGVGDVVFVIVGDFGVCTTLSCWGWSAVGSRPSSRLCLRIFALYMSLVGVG